MVKYTDSTVKMWREVDVVESAYLCKKLTVGELKQLLSEIDDKTEVRIRQSFKVDPIVAVRLYRDEATLILDLV